MNKGREVLLRSVLATADRRRRNDRRGPVRHSALAPSARVAQRALRVVRADERYLVTVSARPDYIWYHVPKTGTRSVRSALLAGSPTILCQDPYGGVVVPRPLVRGVFAFSFVRDPRTRVVSAWRDKILRTNSLGLPHEVHARLVSFPEFVSWLECLDLRTCNRHFRLQSAILDVSRLDFIGRFETLAADFSHLAGILGLESRDLPHLNATRGGQHVWPEDTLDRVESLYRDDLDLFGY